jgi:hypothetical protein
MDHIAFGMPTLILHVSIDLHVLLQNGTVAANAFRREAGRIMVMAINIVLVLVIRILLPE